MARYRLDTPHYINDQLLPAGMEIGEGTGFHFEGIPSMQMTPLDDDAAQMISKHGIHTKRRPEYRSSNDAKGPIYAGPAAGLVQVRKDPAPTMGVAVEQVSISKPQPRQPAMQPQPQVLPEGDKGVSQITAAPNPFPPATPSTAPQSFEPAPDAKSGAKFDVEVDKIKPEGTGKKG